MMKVKGSNFYGYEKSLVRHIRKNSPKNGAEVKTLKTTTYI